MGFTSNIDLDFLWEEGAGTIDIGNGIKCTYNVRPNISKEEWKKSFMQGIDTFKIQERKWWQF